MKGSFSWDFNFFYAGPSDFLDANCDGDVDIAVVRSNMTGFGVLPGDGDGAFADGPTVPSVDVGVPNSVRSGDFDGDGLPDLAFGMNTGQGTGTVAIYLNTSE